MDSQREHERKLKMEPLEFDCRPIAEDRQIYALWDNNGDIWATGILESAAAKIAEAMNEWAERRRAWTTSPK